MGFGLLKNKIKGALGAGNNSDNERAITFDINDFLKSDLALVAGVETQIGEQIIGPQREKAWGSGNTSLDPQNQGRIHVNLKDTSGTPVVLDGILSIYKSDNEGEHVKFLQDFKLSDIRNGEAKKFEREPLTLIDDFVGFNDKLIMKFKLAGTTARTLSASNSLGTISGTKRKVR